MTLYGRAKPHLKVMQSNFKLLMNCFNYGVLFIPPALTVLLWIIMAFGVIKPEKQPLEIAAVVVSGSFMFIAALRFIFSRHVFFLYGPFCTDYVS